MISVELQASLILIQQIVSIEVLMEGLTKRLWLVMITENDINRGIHI